MSLLPKTLQWILIATSMKPRTLTLNHKATGDLLPLWPHLHSSHTGVSLSGIPRSTQTLAGLPHFHHLSFNSNVKPSERSFWLPQTEKDTPSHASTVPDPGSLSLVRDFHAASRLHMSFQKEKENRASQNCPVYFPLCCTRPKCLPLPTRN